MIPILGSCRRVTVTSGLNEPSAGSMSLLFKAVRRKLGAAIADRSVNRRISTYCFRSEDAKPA